MGRKKGTKSEDKLGAKMHDKAYTSIKDTLRRKNKNKKNNQQIITECYVDPTRMISVGGIGKGDASGGDLKAMIRTNKLLRESEEEKNSANDAMFIKQAEHMVRSSQFEAAIKYIYKALEMNPESVKALNLLARVHLLTNNWGDATDAADMVLSMDKKNTKAIGVKAEALFNHCQFEHALVHFYRGMAYSSVREQTEMFRLGVQKCKKIIYDCIPPDPGLFKCEGIEVLFNILKKDFEGKEMPEHERIQQDRKEHVASLSSMMQIAGKKKNLAWNAKAKLVIKEEEKITKQNVKTLVDEEAAEAQRKKLMSKRIKEGRMDTSKILKSKLQRVTVGASAAKTVVEEYVDGHNRRTIKQKGNQRLMKDRAYLNRLSKQLTKRTDVSKDIVHRDVTRVTEEVLNFLKQRDIFWDQLHHT